jgi:hypothetical protein
MISNSTNKYQREERELSNIGEQNASIFWAEE